MLRINQLSLPPEHDRAALTAEAARLLKLSPKHIRRLTVVRRSVDARKKPELRLVYAVDVAVDADEEKLLRHCGRNVQRAVQETYQVPRIGPCKTRPVVVGFGPAGMFAALVLALAGLRPIVLERGDDAMTRKSKVEAFFSGGALDTQSNVAFGEGGAGTFSDGKLHTGVRDTRIRWVLEQFVQAGAPEDILIDAKPHVGTDVLVDVVRRIRERILALGGEVRFRAQVTGLTMHGGAVTGVTLQTGETIACRYVLLAIGHSARDTFQMLQSGGVPMEPKPFAMGVRIEHLQADIDRAQYGRARGTLPPADYKLAVHLPERGVYTFCMCPGGYVVAAASEAGGIVTNGMSNFRREGLNANSALLVGVQPADFPYAGALGGMLWQRELEQRAWNAAGSFFAPAQRLGDFLSHRPSTGAGRIRPTYRPGVNWCDLHGILPALLTSAIEQALPTLDHMLPGFADADAVLTAPETRSSCPVRILRGTDRQSAVRGLYPAGEGAGYAGGIMSAALDGMRTAEVIAQCIQEENP